MKIRKSHNSRGGTLVEMLAAVIIVSIVVIGVLQFLVVSRLNVYTANLRTGIQQLLSDTIVEYQYVAPGTSMTVPVTGDLAQYVSAAQGSPIIQITKSATPTNGTYTVSGTTTWQTFRDGNGTLFKYTENLSLQIPQ